MTPRPRVYNKRRGTPPRGAVLVDRTTCFGNPFPIGEFGTRQEVLVLYRRYLWAKICADEAFARSVRDLHGRDLVCWCAPEPCHAEVLARAAAWLASQ